MNKVKNFLLCLAASLMVLCALANPNDDKIPLNPKVRYGLLENGLQYYIMQNAKPEDKVELYLAVNAGSILEDDDQVGLAHFMEHMNFNGTKNFKKNELVDYLQSVGVKFGAHLNAYTSFDETVYILPIPSDNEAVLDKGLQILEDWAHNANLSEEEIDKERGVVLEEYRTRLGAGERMLKKYLPKLMYGSKYADRMPIGTKENIENFRYESLKNFYKDWYRPDLMAVIAVGDIDVDAMEKKIKRRFSKIKNPSNPREREVFQVPNHDETFISIESDKEQAFSNVQLMYKDARPAAVIDTKSGYRKMLVNQLFSKMLNDRLDEITKEADPPFIYAGASYGSTMARSKNAFAMSAVTDEKEQLRGLEALLTETQRIKLHGFWASELERAKKTMLAGIEAAFNERDKSQSGALVRELLGNFLNQKPVPGIAWEYEQYKAMLPGIGITEVNALINDFIADKNRVIIILGPEKEGLAKVSEQSVLELLERVGASEPAPYEDEVVAQSLMENTPSPAKIVSSETNEAFGFTTLTLENGMKVTYKVTDFRNDEILLGGFSYGGTSTYSDEEYAQTRLAQDVIYSSGVGNFSDTELRKALAGKVVGVSPYISTYSEGIRGSTTPKDMETMFQLINLYFTSPRKDDEAYSSLIQSMKIQYANLNSMPELYFVFEHQKFMNNDHPRSFNLPTEADWNETSHDLIMKKYREAFANPGDFHMFFVGNIEKDPFEQLVKTYLASIKGEARQDSYRDTGVRTPKGTHEKIYKKGVDPKSMVSIAFEGEAEYNRDEAYYLQCLGEVLSIKLIEVMREEKGGVYGVQASGGMQAIPYGHYIFGIRFPCGPENAHKLKETALAELRKIIDNGPEAKDLVKIKEAQRKDLKEQIKRNGYWLSKLRSAEFQQWKLMTTAEREARIDKLSAEDIQSVGKKYLTGDYIVGMLFPEDK